MNADKPVIATLELSFHDTRFEITTAVSRNVAAQRVARSADDSMLVDLKAGQAIRIGRDRANDIIIRDKNVSRFHAVFSASASGVVLSDLSSLNGTYVNTNRISTPLDINSSDEVRIGDTNITVHIGGSDVGIEDSLLGFTQASRLSSVSTTVLVADVCAYTTLSEALPAEDVAESMNRWFCAVSEIVAEHGGEVDKFIGDCVMALWRSDQSGVSTAAQRALAAGVDILKSTQKFSEGPDWQFHETHPWRCRIALNTGIALMGALGGNIKRDITVLGDTVNVAFRLEEAAGEFDVSCLMSSTTAVQVAECFEVRSLGHVEVSGKREAIEVFTLSRPLEECEPKDPATVMVDFAAALEIAQEHPCIADILERLEDQLPASLTYHSLDHTIDVLEEAISFAVMDHRDARELLLLGIAAAYHDAGYLFGAEDHEERGAELASMAMRNDGDFSPLEIEIVRRMILDTKIATDEKMILHKLSTPLSAYLVDADVSNFGRCDFFHRLELYCRETGTSLQTAGENVLNLMRRHRWACSAALNSRQTQKEANILELEKRVSAEIA